MEKLLMLGLFCSISASAAITQSTGCHYDKKHDNLICTFTATGENFKNPIAKSTLYATTNMPYALCSKALCTPDKKNPNLAHCNCSIFGVNDQQKWHRASVGPQAVRKSRPRRKGERLLTVPSNFSMANVKSLNNIPQTTCKSDTPQKWANCFGVKCKVTYKHSTPTAHCACPIVETSTFISMGPDNTSNCKVPNKFWSAATAEQGKNNNAIMGEIYLWHFATKIAPQ